MVTGYLISVFKYGNEIRMYFTNEKFFEIIKNNIQYLDKFAMDFECSKSPLLSVNLLSRIISPTRKDVCEGVIFDPHPVFMPVGGKYAREMDLNTFSYLAFGIGFNDWSAIRLKPKKYNKVKSTLMLAADGNVPLLVLSKDKNIIKIVDEEKSNLTKILIASLTGINFYMGMSIEEIKETLPTNGFKFKQVNKEWWSELTTHYNI